VLMDVVFVLVVYFFMFFLLIGDLIEEITDKIRTCLYVFI
jgi:hypothetical protein